MYAIRCIDVENNKAGFVSTCFNTDGVRTVLTYDDIEQAKDEELLFNKIAEEDSSNLIYAVVEYEDENNWRLLNET